MIRYAFLVLVISFAFTLNAQEHSHALGRKIEFPNIEGYLTLKCDFHIHTVFSDGNVWPTIRVEEAIKDGLDAISLTDHLEYQPHKADIPHPDRNRAFQIAKDFGEANGIMVVMGSEITRSMPPGHCNAIFLTDCNALLKDDALEVFREAKRQGAFVFWNHPNWTAQRPDGVTTLTDMHRQLIREKLLDGIEVINDLTYSAEALQVANDNNLTVMGTSDIHGLVDWQYKVPEGGHRPVTLVLATEKTEAAIKEAMYQKRTIAWFNNMLIGADQWLNQLITSSVKIEEASYQGNSTVLEVKINNHSDADYILQSTGPYTFHAHADMITLKAHDTTIVEVKTIEKKANIELPFKVLNAFSAPGKHAQWTLKVEVK